MWLVVVGVVLLVLKLAGLGGAGAWSWWLVLAPFGAAALWWQVADSVGWTQRAAMRRQQQRVQRRRDERLDALGLPRTPRRAGAHKDPTKPDAAASRRDAWADAQGETRTDNRQDPPKRPPAA